MATAALKLITPTSVAKTGAGSSASIGTNGKVTFTSCVTLSLNGIFSATYDDYLIVVQLAAASGIEQGLAKLRASGTDTTGSDYITQQITALSTSVDGWRGSAATSFYTIPAYGTVRSGYHLYLYGPYLSQATAMRTIGASDNTSAGIIDNASTHSVASSYDGLTLLTASIAQTGTLTVYGLSQ